MMQLAAFGQLRVTVQKHRARVPDRLVFCLQDQTQRIAVSLLQIDAVLRGDFKLGADELRCNRQFPPAAVNERRKPDAGRSPIVKQLVHGRAYGAAGIEYVVNQYQVTAFNFERNVRWRNFMLESLMLEIVAVERYIERAVRHFQGERAMQARGEPYSTSDDADQSG